MRARRLLLAVALAVTAAYTSSGGDDRDAKATTGSTVDPAAAPAGSTFVIPESRRLSDVPDCRFLDVRNDVLAAFGAWAPR